ncbi:hypothetical protein CXB51_003157 [Gossypium anomalum]|uniref:Transposase n=1 Tax=Gossypium anomalum TaxID=47600 RepID=A0A8J5Z6X0_9ROSI|nr:hypothetical protein CXB51_003157 [Gossypium anomalum]
MGIRRDLHPEVLLNGKYRLPPPIFAMWKEEKEVFCTVLKDIKVLDAYASNISRCVNLKDRRLYFLKSHDYHILMQDLLPLALQCSESGGTRRGRGRTLLKDLYDLNPIERVKVSRNSHGQPVGSEARLLVGYLGIIARNANMLPINYESWHHMPDRNKNQALDNIKERFALEVSDDYIKKALGKKWRDHKNTLKKEYFKKDIRLEEILQNVPPGMLKYQWEDAVRFWNSKKGEKVSPSQKVGHLQLFEITYKKKDGSSMTSEAGEIMEKLKEKKAMYEAIASTDSSVNLENIDNRIITEVLGPKRADAAAREAATVVREVAAAAREAEAAAMAAKQSRKYELQLQLQLQHMMKMFQQSQKPPS